MVHGASAQLPPLGAKFNGRWYETSSVMYQLSLHPSVAKQAELLRFRTHCSLSLEELRPFVEYVTVEFDRWLSEMIEVKCNNITLSSCT